ncbi:hypothetical protein BMS3Abin15_00171 [bacterium BMS3Abin15]|nr:hypothetical protein BMS3Abin15_00171 [bacterium BMS3Abin15]
MCIGYCLPFDLDIKEWIIGIGFTVLFLVASWREKEEGYFKSHFLQVIKNHTDQKGINKLFYIIQRSLNYFFRGFIIRQILNPYFLFPFLVILYWLLRIKSWGNIELVLLVTLIVILWYSKETFALREEQRKGNIITNNLKKEQRKSVYLQLLEMEMKDKNSGYKVRVKYPLMVRRIIEKGKFDPKELYSKNWHGDIE